MRQLNNSKFSIPRSGQWLCSPWSEAIEAM